VEAVPEKQDLMKDRKISDPGFSIDDQENIDRKGLKVLSTVLVFVWYSVILSYSEVVFNFSKIVNL